MEVSPKTFREVEFREKLRGYHPEDVDQFLEQMAAGVEVLQERLRQAVERAQRAEQLAAEAGSSDETLRRTLVLAQRTADLAVQEAREQAARLVASAEQRASAMLTEAEERARKLHNEALADVQAEFAKLEATRAHSQQEVDALERWAGEQRGRLVTMLQEAAASLDRAGLTSPPPASTPLDVPRVPMAPRPSSGGGNANGEAGSGGNGAQTVAPPPGSPAPSGAPGGTAPASHAPAPSSEPGPDEEPEAESPADPRGGELPPAHSPSGPPSAPRYGASDRPPIDVDDDSDAPGDGYEGGPDDEALNSFFQGDEYGDDHRFGGRLRRRR